MLPACAGREYWQERILFSNYILPYLPTHLAVPAVPEAGGRQAGARQADIIQYSSLFVIANSSQIISFSLV